MIDESGASQYPENYPGIHQGPGQSSGVYQPLPQQLSTKPAMWARLGTLLTWLGGFLIFAPAVLFCWVTPFAIRNKWPYDQFVRHHATQALNSTITGLVIIPALLIVVIAASALGAGTAVAIMAAIVYVGLGVTRGVCEIIGAVKASNGEFFPLPVWLAFPFFKEHASLAS